MLPKALRDAVWAAYRPGQEATMTPSREYLRVAHEVQTWIRRNYPNPNILTLPEEVSIAPEPVPEPEEYVP